jgi:hypothetical protein
MRSHPHLLEISAWPWLERLSRGSQRLITLGNVPGESWDDLAQRGFDLVFLMGVWRRSPIGREIARTHSGLIEEYDRVLPGWTANDVVGSPYCVQAYEPDERMGGWAGLEQARRELNRRGLSLILDFVPNHTAFDHPWIHEHPDRYVQGTADDLQRAPAHFRTVRNPDGAIHIACGRDPYFDPWTDVAQLNYFNPDTREAMRDVLRTIASHCDGLRCDMAMLVLNDVFDRTWRGVLRDRWPIPQDDFWEDAIRATSRLTYLAEVYWELEGALLDRGFDFAYDKPLLDALRAGDPGRVRDLLGRGTPNPERVARFIENHDEPRSAATFRSHLPAAAALLASLPGMRFFFDGQSDGRRLKVPVQLGRWPDEAPDASVQQLYERVLLFAAQPVLHDGVWRILKVASVGDDTAHSLVAYRWHSDDALALVVVNLGDHAAQGHVHLADDMPAGAIFDFRDWMTDAHYRRPRELLMDSGLYVRLEPGTAHLFTVHERRGPDSASDSHDRIDTL